MPAVKRARILVLDEATAFLDADSEHLIHEALLRLKNDHTIFVVAHRLSTVCLADRVLVLEGGRIVEQGVHEVLSHRDSRFREIFHHEMEASGSKRLSESPQPPAVN